MPMDPSYLTQEDTIVESSNGVVNPATDVQRKLQQSVGAGSCPDVCGNYDPCYSCDGVTASSVIGDNSCTYYYSCYELDGKYSDNNTRVSCL